MNRNMLLLTLSSALIQLPSVFCVTAVPYGTTGSPPAVPIAVTPASYGPPPLPPYTPAPRHYYQYAAPSYYHQPPAYAPAHYKHEKPYHDDGSVTPTCALTAIKKNVTERSWCLVDDEYPARQVQLAIEYHYSAVAALYKDVVANTANSADRLKHISDETYVCPSETQFATPLRAKNTDGRWRVIVNGVKAHYESLSQTVRMEECLGEGLRCALVPQCYDTKCVQKSAYHRFLVYDAKDYHFPFAIESFKLPSSCACYQHDYVAKLHHNKV